MTNVVYYCFDVYCSGGQFEQNYFCHSPQSMYDLYVRSSELISSFSTNLVNVKVKNGLSYIIQ